MTKVANEWHDTAMLCAQVFLHNRFGEPVSLILLGREHQADANNPAQPSYCTLPVFHAPLNLADTAPGGVGYVSGDGHHFGCRNPVLLQQAFHV